MISEDDRVRIRSVHVRADGKCTVRTEDWPCDALKLLDELEVVEAQGRMQYEQMLLANQRNKELRQKILRAVRELS